MINIRQGAFETNSSSMHCFIIANKHPDLSKEKYGTRAEIETNYKGKKRLVIKDIDFSNYGEDDILETWFDKLAYVFAYHHDKRWYEDVETLKRETIEAVLDRHPDISEVVFPDIDMENNYFINHQSYDNFADFIDSHHLSWESVVFDDRYVIVPTADCRGRDDIISDLAKLGYGDFKEITAWSTHQIIDGKVCEECFD